ncbi:MAG: amidohydrolase family protein [Acidobacteria bacterium]|nr:amidohydrolase family protein [Acidobacteriota bacterium]
MRNALLSLLALALYSCNSVTYDVVIQGGRVMDPETGLDAVRNVGIQGSEIAVITEDAISGKQTLDAGGKVVAPGFIDLHQHGDSPEVYRAKIHDGVTSALELELGVEDVAAWYAAREGKTALNFGATISHTDSRRLAMGGKLSKSRLSGDWAVEPMTAEQIEAMKQRLADGLEQGAVGIGMLIAYTPGTTAEEIDAIFSVAKAHNAAAYVHMRTNDTDINNLEEVLTPARRYGTQLHIVHLNSSGRDRAPEFLARIRAAQAEGIDITTESYPYNRGSTYIDSHAFDNWRQMSDEEIAGHIWVETGENLTRETFAKYKPTGGLIISPASYSEESVRNLVADPIVMVASDGMWLTNGKAHPRTWGTYARVLGRYVREQKALSLMDALKKMTVLPADRVSQRIPAMKKKGRVQVGADADLVIFDPETIIDQATYQDPVQDSTGIDHVVVNGVITLKDGQFQDGATGGKPIRANAE